MNSRKLYFETLCISLAVILLEISYTRVFSFKLVYYFTYMIIGISLLGLGSGGVFVAMFPRFRRTTPSRLIPACCIIGGTSVLVGYFIVARTPVNPFEIASGAGAALRETVKLLAVCLTLFTPFFTAGVALATIFATQTERINRL